MDLVIKMNNEFKHYGVPGMKWRFRKGPKITPEERKRRREKDKELFTKEVSKNTQSIIRKIRANKKQYMDIKASHMSNAEKMSKGRSPGAIASLAAIGEMATSIKTIKSISEEVKRGITSEKAYKNSKEYKFLKGEIKWEDYMKKTP